MMEVVLPPCQTPGHPNHHGGELSTRPTYAEQLITTVGLPCAPPKAAAPLRASAGVYVSAEASGVVADADVLRDYAAVAARAGGRLGECESLAYFKPMVRVGDAVVGPAEADDFPTWLAGFMLHAPTVDEAIARAKALNDEVVARVTVA